MEKENLKILIRIRMMEPQHQHLPKKSLLGQTRLNQNYKYDILSKYNLVFIIFII